MSNRLQPYLHELVDNNQTAFVKGRSMMESFLVTRELLAFCSKQKLPAVLYKVDFEKAFDTVDWCFMTNLLIERGFPPKWLSALLAILHTSTSSIRVNGNQTRHINHMRGLRQGDPLSPMLFILVADSLSRFLHNAQPVMGPHVLLVTRAIQFADDTVIISEGHPTSLKAISRILTVYAELSGLRINRSKSAYIPIALPTHMVQTVTAILASQPTQMPVKYLGLPLTLRKPRKVHFQPMIRAIRSRIEGWKANLLSYGGRITLVKSVLSAIPLHFMQALRMPKGVIKHIDKMRRSFLWRGNRECKGINCLANWETTCALKSNGGMGIMDLGHQNEALLLKWIWWLQHHSESQWSQTLSHLYGITDEVSLTQRASEYFFLKDLAALSPFYTDSVTGSPGQPVRQWRWNSNGRFTVASAYSAMHDTGTKSAYHMILWKLKVPMKVKVFLWLLLLDRILTHENLIKRGCQVNTGCMQCASTDVETAGHIMWTCPFVKTFWLGLCAQVNIPRRTEQSIRDAWLMGRMRLHGRARHQWDMAWAGGCWTMWKERNIRTFSGTSKTLSILIDETTTNLYNWELFA